MISVGDIIDNRYRITELIGSGGSANVFEADDFISGRFVAIKIMKENLLNNQNNVDSFKEETNVLATMSHPNIVQIYNEGTFKNCPYVVIEYIKEQTLEKKIDFLTKFNVEEAIDIMIQLLDAIDYVHNHGLIHRDIKPQNIFYLYNGTVKLGDFGIATLEKQTSNKIIGSIQYLAPEVFDGVKFSKSTDIYSAGVTFYQLLVGRLPFNGNKDEIVSKIKKSNCIKPSNLVAGLDSNIDDIVLKSINKHPSLRFLNANQFKKALLEYKNGTYKHDSFLKKMLKKL